MTMRKDGETIESTHGWGEYSITEDGWNYGYHYLEMVRGPGEGAVTRAPARPPSSRLLKLEWDSQTLVVLGGGTDRREYTRESFVSAIGGDGDFRRWRRIE